MRENKHEHWFEGELYDRWPKDESGEPEEPALLGTCINLNMADELVINMLEAYGIPCLRVYPGDGSFGKVILGMSGEGTEIYVPKSLFEDAVNLCSGTGEEDDFEFDF